VSVPCICPYPPYYSVMFTNQRADDDSGVSGDMADRMFQLAAKQPGYLGVDSARDAYGFGITVSYWQDLASIEGWRTNSEHLEARRLGREKWYQSYSLRLPRSSGPKSDY
jgi:heme-degrading monooxygenase HmoA